jgi:hypothetical protein
MGIKINQTENYEEIEKRSSRNDYSVQKLLSSHVLRWEFTINKTII